jgi:hypothetical protein
MKCSKLPVVSKLILTCVRFADRDMLMRYHWGLGIGHIYSHEHHSHPSHSILADSGAIEPDDTSEEQANDLDLCPMEWDDDNDNGGPMEVEDPELGLEELDNEPELEWDSESELGPNEGELSDMNEISDEELELYSTYYEVDY